MPCNPPHPKIYRGYRNVESKIDIEPFYFMLIIITHITYGIAIAYCAGKLDCFHR